MTALTCIVSVSYTHLPYLEILEKESSFIHLVFHAPRVKSGISTGMLPFNTDFSLNSVMQDHAAASYTSMSRGRPLRRQYILSAVSYTHLDVYKRQHFISPVNVKYLAGRSQTVSGIGITPVSYTHLRDLREPNRGIDDIFADAMNSSPVEAPVFYEPDGTTNHVKWGTTAVSYTHLRDNLPMFIVFMG